MANDFVQTMIDARVDARSLSDFMFYPASEMITRRLAPSINTLNYYLDYFNGLEALYSQESGTVTVNGVEIKTVRQAMSDAIDDVLLGEYQDGMRADLNAQKLDTGITATAKFGGVERTQAQVNSDVISINDFTSPEAAYAAAIDNNISIYVPSGDFTLSTVDADMTRFYGLGTINSNKLSFDEREHKTTQDYAGATKIDRVQSAFNADEYVEVKEGTYNLLNSNTKAFSMGLVTPKQKSTANITNVVANADEVGSLSSGNSTAQRWDLAFAYPQKTGMTYHPFPSGFYIMPDYATYYVWHKPDTGVKATLVKKTLAGVIQSEIQFPDDAPQGETFTILNNKMYVGGRLQDPKFHVYDATNGTQSDYYLWGGVTFASRQFAYLDPLNQKRVIVFARKSGIGYGIFEYHLDKYTTDATVKTLTLQKELSFPDLDETKFAVQGFTAMGQMAYLVCEDIGASLVSKVKYLYTYRLTDGKLIEIKKFNPNGTYRDSAKYGDANSADANYESEGLQAQVNTARGKSSSDLFAGLITGISTDTSATKYRYLIFKSSIGGENSMAPVVQGMPVRGGLGGAANTGGGYVQQYYITLQKQSGTWKVYDGNYEAAISVQTVQKVAVETLGGQSVIAFYLLNVFLSRINASCSINRPNYHAFVDRGDYGGNSGGGISAKQIVVLCDSTGSIIDPSTAPDGMLIEVSLTVISG